MILTKKKYHLTFDSPTMIGHAVTRKVSEWTSSNGSIKLLCDLDINHLKNIIAKMERGELEERIYMRVELNNELQYRTLENNNDD